LGLQAQGVPTLTTIVIDGPTPSECGAAKVKRKWEINPATPTGGYVVQRITMTGDIKSCWGDDLTSDRYKGDGLKYTETWSIFKGHTFSNLLPFDNFSSGFKGFCTFGWFQIEGEGEFCETDTVPLPPGFGQGNVKEALLAPSKLGHHSPFPNCSNKKNFTLKVSWDCCRDEDRTTVIELP
jgi:hypothetical protein